jgi:hypothetical protein
MLFREIFNMNDVDQALNSLYVWDGIEKRGFPVTPDVMIVDIDGLTWEQKQVIAAGNELEVAELMKEEGQELGSFIMMGATVFTKLMHVIYENETPEKREEINNLIKNTMRDIIERFSDDSE